MRDDDDDTLRDELARLPLPPETTQFFDDLWRRANEQERALARRWRRTAIGLAVIAVAAIASTATVVTSTGAATNVADVRATCASQYQGGLPVFTAHAEPSDKPTPGEKLPAPPPGFKPVQGLWIATPAQTFLTLSPFSAGFTIDRRVCKAYRNRVDLGHKGLSLVGTYRNGGYTNFNARCLDVARIGFRLRVTMDPGGLPTSAQLAIVRARNGAPLVYVEWSPDTVTGWAAKRCRESS